MSWISLNALLQAQSASSGDIWIVLATVKHSTFSAPLRLASPRYQPITSNGLVFSNAVFDVVYPSDQFDESARASVTFDGVNGQILAALQGLRPRPTVTFEIVLESDPDEVIFTAPDFEISNVTQDGVTMTTIELEVSRVFSLPFPGINMDRRRVPGMFTDL